jgi:hypothetical protein
MATLLGLTSHAERRGLRVRKVTHWLVVTDMLDRHRLVTLVDRRRDTYLGELEKAIAMATSPRRAL